VAAAAQTRNPVRQALVSSTGTFWDTVVICALTGLVLVSSIISLDIIWNIADCMNALMAIPNLIALLLLSGVAAKETNRYLWADKLDDEMEESGT